MNHQIKYIAALFFFLGCSIHSFAQPYDYHFDLLNETHGLSNRNTEYAIQDYRGYIWIATDDGLNRYDGYSFKAYRHIPGDSSSLMHNRILRLEEDSQHRIWIGYNYNDGLSCFDPATEKFTNYYPDPKNPNALPTGYIKGMHIDGENNIWLGLVTNGFVKLDTKKNVFKHYGPLPDISTDYDPHDQLGYNSAYYFLEEKDTVWIGTHNGLYAFEKKTERISPVRPHKVNTRQPRDDLYTAIISDSNYGLWLSAWAGGLTYYNHSTQVWKNFKFDTISGKNAFTNVILDIKWKSKTEIWCCTDGAGLLVFNTVTEKFYPLEANPSRMLNLPDALYRNILIDRSGNLWISGYKGVSLLRASSSIFNFHFQSTTKSDNGNFYGVVAVEKDTARKLLYIALDYGDGLNVLNEKTGVTKHYSIPTPAFAKDVYNIRDILIAKNGMLWIASNKYLLQFDPASNKIISPLQPDEIFPLFNEYIFYNLLEDAIGNIWITTYGKGLYCYNPLTKTYLNYRHDTGNKNSICSDYLFSIAEDKKNNLWIGSFDSGLTVFNPHKKTFTNFEHDEKNKISPAANKINGIVVDSINNVWVATNGGISSINGNEYSKGVFTNKTPENGMNLPVIKRIFCDRNNTIWFTTVHGLHQWQVSTNRIGTFNERNGLDENYHIYSFKEAVDGEIFIGTYKGYFRFYPEQITSSTSPPNVLINSFRIFDKEIALQPMLKKNNRIVLNYAENYFSFEFASINYSDPEKVKYAYQLEGIDDDWIYCDNRRFANYTNVQGGNYTFKVKAMNGDGVWMKTPLQIPIHIDKPFWQKVWFRILLLILLLLLLRFYFLLYKRKQQEEEADKSIIYFANSVYGKNTEEEILWDMARNVISRLNFNDCVIYLVDEERNVLVQKAAMGAKNAEGNQIVSALEIPIGQGIVGAVALSGKPEIIKDTSKDERYIADDDVRFSEITVPVIYRDKESQDKVIAVIDSEHPAKNFYNKRHLKFLETIASISATKIVKAKTEREIEEKERKLLEVGKQIAETRLQAIRAQMNPHFIFNCLNSIDKYILKNDEEKASRYLNKFARLIRLILVQSEKLNVTLATEAEMLLYYMELESIRFEKAFTYEINIDKELDAEDIEIPSMIIQPYIENAIWHGFMNKPANGKITMNFCEKENILFCTIEDNGIGRAKAMEYKTQSSVNNASMGMKLTEERINIINAKNKNHGSVKIIDLKDEQGNGIGTRVELVLPIM